VISNRELKPGTIFVFDKFILFLIIFILLLLMVIISKSKIIQFYETHPTAKQALLKWYHVTLLSDWKNFTNIKESFNSVDNIGNDRFVFNIAGNKYRIVAMIHFTKRTVYLRFVGTHKQYDEIDCKTV
jgi:mRNA interferase HigB